MQPRNDCAHVIKGADQESMCFFFFGKEILDPISHQEKQENEIYLKPGKHNNCIVYSLIQSLHKKHKFSLKSHIVMLRINNLSPQFNMSLTPFLYLLQLL